MYWITLPIFYLLSLATFSVAVPFNLENRALDLTSAVLSDISTLNSSLTTLGERVSDFNGGLLQSLGVLAASTELDLQVQKTTATVSISGSFNSTESNQITLAFAGLLSPITSGLSLIKEKYPIFKSALQAPVVLLTLQALKAHTDGLISATEEKVTSPTLLELGRTVIDGAFNSTIAVYQG